MHFVSFTARTLHLPAWHAVVVRFIHTTPMKTFVVLIWLNIILLSQCHDYMRTRTACGSTRCCTMPITLPCHTAAPFCRCYGLPAPYRFAPFVRYYLPSPAFSWISPLPHFLLPHSTIRFCALLFCTCMPVLHDYHYQHRTHCCILQTFYAFALACSGFACTCGYHCAHYSSAVAHAPNYLLPAVRARRKQRAPARVPALLLTAIPPAHRAFVHYCTTNAPLVTHRLFWFHLLVPALRWTHAAALRFVRGRNHAALPLRMPATGFVYCHTTTQAFPFSSHMLLLCLLCYWRVPYACTFFLTCATYFSAPVWTCHYRFPRNNRSVPPACLRAD